MGFSKNLLPFTCIVSMECINVALNTLFKAAATRGMSRFVFIFYAYTIAALLLLPFPFIDRGRVLPPMSVSLLSKIGLLGIVGSTSQIAGFKGIEYSSPTLASAISNLTPAFTFILAVIFRIEKLEIKNSSTRAKISGTIVSIIGAFIVTLYKGPVILTQLSEQKHLSVISSSSSYSSSTNWVTGSVLLVIEYSLISFWYVIQAHIMKEYPSELTIVFYYNLCVAIVASTVGLIVEPDRTVWIIRLDISLLSILASGFFGSLMGVAVHTWGLRLKGPVYVVMFKPLSVVIAVAMGVIFLGDTLHVGSVIGATVISVGFYTVMWGKTKEEMKERSESLEKSPLLSSHSTQSLPM